MLFSLASEVLWKETAIFHHLVRNAPSSLRGGFYIISAVVHCRRAAQVPAHLVLAHGHTSRYWRSRPRIVWCCLSFNQAKLKNWIDQNLSEVQSEFCSWHPFLLKTLKAGTVNCGYRNGPIKAKMITGCHWAHRKCTSSSMVSWFQVSQPVFFFFTLIVVAIKWHQMWPPSPKQGIQEQKYKFLMVHYLFCWSATCPSNLFHNSGGWRDEFQQSACFVGGSFSLF